MHGGGKKAAKENGLARVRAAKAAEFAEKKLGFDVLDTSGFDPIQVMIRAVMKLEAMQESLASIVNGLEELRYQGGSGEQLRAEVELYRRLLNDVIAGGERLAKLDLEGKRQAAAERYAGELVGLLNAILVDLALSEQQQVRVPVVVAHHLGQVVAGQVEGRRPA